MEGYCGIHAPAHPHTIRWAPCPRSDLTIHGAAGPALRLRPAPRGGKAPAVAAATRESSTSGHSSSAALPHKHIGLTHISTST